MKSIRINCLARTILIERAGKKLSRSSLSSNCRSDAGSEADDIDDGIVLDAKTVVRPSDDKANSNAGFDGNDDNDDTFRALSKCTNVEDTERSDEGFVVEEELSLRALLAASCIRGAGLTSVRHIVQFLTSLESMPHSLEAISECP